MGRNIDLSFFEGKDPEDVRQKLIQGVYAGRKKDLAKLFVEQADREAESQATQVQVDLSVERNEEAREANRIAREANKISRTSNVFAMCALAISIVAVVVSMFY